jgi:hypothetical protein
MSEKLEPVLEEQAKQIEKGLGKKSRSWDDAPTPRMWPTSGPMTDAQAQARFIHESTSKIVWVGDQTIDGEWANPKYREAVLKMIPFLREIECRQSDGQMGKRMQRPAERATEIGVSLADAMKFSSGEIEVRVSRWEDKQGEHVGKITDEIKVKLFGILGAGESVEQFLKRCPKLTWGSLQILSHEQILQIVLNPQSAIEYR